MAFVNRSSYPSDPPILVHSSVNEAPKNVQLPNTKLTADSTGRKTVKAGYFVALSEGVVRVLPRTSLTVLSATNSPTITVSDSTIFTVGDVLTVVEPRATVTIGGTIAVDDAVTAVIAGHSVTFTATTTVLNDAAVGLAAAINNGVYTSQIAFAIAVGAVVNVYGRDGITLHTLTASKVGTNVTITASAAALVPSVAVGTVSSINTTTNVITLTGNASTALPVGTHIGVAVSDIYGFVNESIDMTDRGSADLGLYAVASGVRENLLPYIDGNIKARFPKILFSNKF